MSNIQHFKFSRGQALLIASLTPGFLNAQVSPEKPLDIEEAAKQALNNHPAMRKALAGLQKSQGQLSEARSSKRAQISLAGQAAYIDRKNTIDFGTLLGAGSVPMTITPQWNPAWSATLALPIDLSGAILAATSQAEFGMLSSRMEIERVRRAIIFDAKSAFIRVIRQQEQVQVDLQALETTKLRLKNVRFFENAGNASKFDVSSAERDLAESQQRVDASQANLSIELSKFKLALGFDQSASLKSLTPPSLQDTKSTESLAEAFGVRTGKLDPTSYDSLYLSYVERAMTQRIEIQQFTAQVEAAKHGVRLANTLGRPNMFANLNYTNLPNNGAFSLPQSTTATIGISFPLNDGGRAKAKRQQADALLDDAQAQVEMAKLSIQMEVQNAFVNLRLSARQYRTATTNLATAKEAARLARVRYQIGVSKSSVVSPLLELSVAETALVSAEARVIQTRFDLELARLTLDYVAGEAK